MIEFFSKKPSSIALNALLLNKEFNTIKEMMNHLKELSKRLKKNKTGKSLLFWLESGYDIGLGYIFNSEKHFRYLKKYINKLETILFCIDKKFEFILEKCVIEFYTRKEQKMLESLFSNNKVKIIQDMIDHLSTLQSLLKEKKSVKLFWDESGYVNPNKTEPLEINSKDHLQDLIFYIEILKTKISTVQQSL